jgi:2',3'-cyclic-nucleotide 2'-phosphodiesterase (5'-nucleotidase family)
MHMLRSNLQARKARIAAATLALGAAFAVLAATAQAGPRARIHLVFTNDIHGHVAPEGAVFMNPNFPPQLGGGASAKAYVDKLRVEIANEPDSGLLLVDAGDTWQGAPVGTLTQGQVMEAYFNAMEYDAIIPGNHEFDKGEAVVKRLAANLTHKFVCANIFKTGTDSLVDWAEPYRIVERAGLRIGIIGANTPGTEQMAFAENIRGLEFRPILPAVEKWRDHLLQREKVDLVVLVVHDGLPFDAKREWERLQQRERAGEDLRQDVRGAMDLAHVLEGVPVMVGGHTHRGYREPWIDPLTQALVLETFGNGSSLGHIMLDVDRSTKQVVGWEAPRRDGILVTLFQDEWWPDEDMKGRLRPFIETAQKGLDVKVGSSRVELSRRGGSNGAMGNLVTTAMQVETGADMAFTNLGGLRADLAAGTVTAGDLLRVMPFDNALAVVQMKGTVVREIFERKSGRGSAGIAQSGAKVTVDPDAPEGERVRELFIGGNPVHPDSLYKVCTTDYLLEGNSGLGFLAEIDPDQVYFTQTIDRVALMHYLEKHSPVAPRADDRWRERKDTPVAEYLRNWAPEAAAPQP